MRAHYEVTEGRRLRAVEHRTYTFPLGENMLAIRLYISALTLIFLFLVIANRGLGILEAVVITCAVVYLILDVRTDLQMLKGEFRLLEELEKHVAELRRQIP
jgi:hypothetical protein